MPILFSIPIAFIQDFLCHLDHEVDVFLLHLPGMIEEKAEAGILMERFEAFIIDRLFRRGL